MLYRNYCSKRTSCLVITEEITWSNLCSVLLIRHFRGWNSSKTSQMSRIVVYDTKYLRKIEKQFFFVKKHPKHGGHIMIMV